MVLKKSCFPYMNFVHVAHNDDDYPKKINAMYKSRLFKYMNLFFQDIFHFEFNEYQFVQKQYQIILDDVYATETLNALHTSCTMRLHLTLVLDSCGLTEKDPQ